MAVKLNVNNVLDEYKEKGGKTKFESSLKDILHYAEKDDNLTSISQLAYLLATAKAESDYSLIRWEADYLCDDHGLPLNNYPCQKALDYYRSTSGKENYYNLGTDKHGLPYFGRGLIQLTGKANYEIYGKLIGKDLVNDGNLALEPKNSYRIASEYLNRKRGSSKKSTYDWLEEGNLTQARKSVNGGTSDLDLVNNTYYFWLPILQKHGTVVDRKGRIKKIVGVGVLLATVGITGILLYMALKKSNKLPNFMKKIKL